MKLSEISRGILEAPQSVPAHSFGLDNPETNLKMYNALKNNTVIKKIGEFVILQGANNFSLLKGTEIYYYMEYQIASFLSHQFTQQTVLWRQVSTDQIKGVAKMVFWDHLFPIKNIVGTSQEQTREGAQFWQSRVMEAYGKNHNVYLTLPSKLYEIKDPDHFNNLRDQIWSGFDNYQSRLILISSAKLI